MQNPEKVAAESKTAKMIADVFFEIFPLRSSALGNVPALMFIGYESAEAIMKVSVRDEYW